MKRNNDTESISDILLKDIGLNLDDVQSMVEGSRELRKISPSIRFNMDTKEAFQRLLRCYQYEVQSRRCHFVLDQYTIAALKNVAEHMTGETPKSGLMLCGLQGNGKSTMANAILMMIRDLNYQGHFKYMGDYFSIECRKIKATDICTLHKAEDFRSISNLKMKPILVIDDLGEEPKEVLVYGTPTFPVREILEARYDSLLFTIITTNLSPKDLPDHYGWRVVDRFREMYHQVAFKGESYRTNQ